MYAQTAAPVLDPFGALPRIALALTFLATLLVVLIRIAPLV